MCGCRERADGCPLREDEWEVELLDDSLVEQAGQEQHETLDSVVRPSGPSPVYEDVWRVIRIFVNTCAMLWLRGGAGGRGG
jgi:hypothetical protein